MERIPGGARIAIEGPLSVASCEPDAALTDAFRAGVPLRWRRAAALLPRAALERALVRRVEVRAAAAGVCDGRVVVTEPVFSLRGRRGEPVEVVVASAIAPTLGVALRPADLAVAPPDGVWRVTRRDAFTAYGRWDLGAYLPPPSPASSESR